MSPARRLAPGERAIIEGRVDTITVRPRACLKLLALVGAAGAGLALLVYLAHAPILEWIGEQLLHEDPLEPSDVIVVLAGSTPAREIEAADLFGSGYAPEWC